MSMGFFSEPERCSSRWPVHYVDLLQEKHDCPPSHARGKTNVAVHLLSFASSDCAPSLRRLVRQAEAMSVFSSIMTATEQDLAPSFRAKFSEYLQAGVRGFGYWMWKPEIILRTLERIPNGDVLLYLDAGCHLNPAGRARFSQYVDWTGRSSSGLLAFQYRSFSSAPANYPTERVETLLDRQYTKREALDALGISPRNALLDDPAIAAGIVFVRKSSAGNATLELWRGTVDAHPEAFTDAFESSLQDSSFREARHDQSVFSIRAKEQGIDTVSAYETWIPKTSGPRPNWNSLAMYPIHARRDLKYSAFSRNGIRRLRGKIGGFVDKVFFGGRGHLV